MVDEEALLEQFAAQFAHGPGDLDDTNAFVDSDADEGANEGADINASAATDNARSFDVNDFLTGLDTIFDRHAASREAGPYLEQAMVDAENAGDEAGLLTVLNETMGFYRSQGWHEKNQWIVQRSLELAARMGLTTTTDEAWATTLINCATAMRAAKQYDQAEDLYAQTLSVSEQALSPTDRRLAALHNNLSMLYSETNRLDKAESELREALRIIEASSVNPQADIDVASSNTNLALTLLSEGKLDEAHDHAARALDIYKTGHLEHSAHYASALAGFAQVCFAEHRYAEAVEGYRKALDVIEECYGTDTDYWRITADNLKQAEEAARRNGESTTAQADGATGETSATASNNTIANSAGANDTKTADTPHTSISTADVGNSADTQATCDVKTADNQPTDVEAATARQTPHVPGLKLAKAFWTQVGKPMIAERYPEYTGRIAAGLVGHGSECYGFDDAYSQDHDFGPRFCLWLDDDTYEVIGEQLQADYEALPRNYTVDEQGRPQFLTAEQSSTSSSGNATNNPLSPATPRAQGENRRDGVFRIGDFFESITGYRTAPAADRPHEWLMLDEATLAAATNGEVFADPTGLFSKTRQGFKDMPDDVRLALISKRLGMIAQAGQYNLPRSLKRGDGAAAWLSISEFVEASASLVFLINVPMVAGYLPYYKWRFAALRKLSGSMFALLPDVSEQLETVMQLASAACYGGAGFGEGGKGSAPAAERINEIVEHIAATIVKELQREHLTTSNETFLEWQRPYVEEHIASDDPVLHSL